MDTTHSDGLIKKIKEFIITLEQNKNNSEITEPILRHIKTLTYVLNYKPDFVQWVVLQSVCGNSYAQDYLGDLYYYGFGVEKNYNEAVKLFKMSADQGNTHGMYNLGYMYNKGHGVTANKSIAYKLLIKASCLGSYHGEKYLKDILSEQGMTAFNEMLKSVS